jgi:hypothetical protein
MAIIYECARCETGINKIRIPFYAVWILKKLNYEKDNTFSHRYIITLGFM